MKILHRIGAVLGGLLAGGIAVFAIQAISSLIYKMPVDLDQNDLQAMSEWVGSLPVGAFLFVLVSEACGYFIGTFLARRLAPERSAFSGADSLGDPDDRVHRQFDHDSASALVRRCQCCVVFGIWATRLDAGGTQDLCRSLQPFDPSADRESL